MAIIVKTKKTDVLIGMLLSLIVNLASSYLYLEIFSKFSVEESLVFIKKEGLIGEVITLGAIPNVLFFFAFLKKKQDDKARGVLLGVVFVALVTLVLKFI